MVQTTQSSVGRVSVVSNEWSCLDHVGAIAVRLNIRRMRYRVEPGLYAVGMPASDSPVLVTANYKLSFDHLRRALEGISAWILVLNTRGVNVWCAAGKGTFGTDELVKKIRSTKLAGVVKHSTLILPQLGAPGVAAHEVTRQTGFTVVYGPVRVADIPEFLRRGMQCTPEMRRVKFPLADRLAVIPVELVQRFLPALALMLMFILLAVIRNHGLHDIAGICLSIAFGVWGNFFAGTVLVPALLPWLPGRAFAIKGAAVGLGTGLVPFLSGIRSFGETAGFLLLSIAACSYLGLMFTGSTHYTSASGVRREVRRAVPLQVAAAVAGVVLWLI